MESWKLMRWFLPVVLMWPLWGTAEPPRENAKPPELFEPEPVRWDRFGEIRLGEKTVGRFLYSSLFRPPFSEGVETLAGGSESSVKLERRFSRLLLERVDAKSTERVAHYQFYVPFDAEKKESRLAWLFVDCSSGQWLLLRERSNLPEGPEGRTAARWVQLEVPGWRSDWLEQAPGGRAASAFEEVRALVPELLQTLERLPSWLPEPPENRAFPHYYDIHLRQLAELLGLKLAAAGKELQVRVVDRRVARGERRNEGFVEDFAQRFGRWARWNEFPVKTAPWP